MSLPNPGPILTVYRGCRCGRIVIAPDDQRGLWCPSAEAGIHDWLTPYPF